MIPTTIPIVPEPETDETLSSWFDRLAAANHQPLSWVFTTTRLAASDNYRDAPTNYGVFLTEQQTRGIHDATGVPEARIRQMLTSSWIGTYTTGINHKGEPVTEAARYAQRNWIYSSGSHYCPHCLTDSPAWRLAWKLPWSIACTTHGTWMETTCPHCEVRASVGRPDGQVKPGFVRQVPKPGRCGNGKPGSRTKTPCWHDLRTVTTSPAPDWVLTMQQQLDNHAHHWRLDQWRDLRALNVYTTTTLQLPHVEDILERDLPDDLQAVWEQQWAERLQRLEQSREQRAKEGHTHWRSSKDSYARQPSTDPRLHATATAVALTTLTSDEALIKAMQHGTHAPTVIPPVNRLTGYTITPELQERAKIAYLADRADVWEAGLLPRYANKTRTHITWDPDHLPPYIWNDLLEEHIIPLTRGAPLQRRTIARTTSIALYRLAAGGTWEDAAAHFLDGIIKDRILQRRVFYLIKKTHGEQRIQDYLRAVNTIATALNTDPRIDTYPQDRAAANIAYAQPLTRERYLETIPTEHRKGHHCTEQRRRNSAIYLWVRIASDERRNAPTWPQHPPSEWLLDQYTWWLRHADPRIITALNEMADHDRETNRTLTTPPLADST